MYDNGVYTDPSEAYADEFTALTRYHRQSRFERQIEEARWARLSGPVTVRRVA